MSSLRIASYQSMTTKWWLNKWWTWRTSRTHTWVRIWRSRRIASSKFRTIMDPWTTIQWRTAHISPTPMVTCLNSTSLMIASKSTDKISPLQNLHKWWGTSLVGCRIASSIPKIVCVGGARHRLPSKEERNKRMIKLLTLYRPTVQLSSKASLKTQLMRLKFLPRAKIQNMSALSSIMVRRSDPRCLSQSKKAPKCLEM